MQLTEHEKIPKQKLVELTKEIYILQFYFEFSILISYKLIEQVEDID